MALMNDDNEEERKKEDYKIGSEKLVLFASQVSVSRSRDGEIGEGSNNLQTTS